MAGESIVSQSEIETRAENLEAAQEKEAAEKAVAEKTTPEKEAADKAAAEKEVVRKNEFEKQPEDAKELRKWATRVSMENADIKKKLDHLAEMLSRKEKNKVDWKELAKDPVKLQKAIEDRENELVETHKSEYSETLNKQTAEITAYESKVRAYDKENYPDWVEMLPYIRKLAEPRPDQPNGDPRVNFNQHPKIVLDDLYALAKELAAKDPAFKKPEDKPAGKSYTQEELDAKIAEAKAAAQDEASKGLAAEKKGEGVGSMGTRTPKGKPGEVNKEALWNMPLNDLKGSIRKATEQMHS